MMTPLSVPACQGFSRVLLGGLALVFSLGVNVAARAEDVPVRMVVRFNTVCANCHEAQCSGRLSFDSGAEAARGHMQRYLGPLSDEDVRFLFRVLRYTKENCGYYPLEAGLVAGRLLNETELEHWRNPHEGAYFVPVGPLAQGEYVLRAGLRGPAQGRIRITDDDFDPVAEESLCPERPARVEFSVEGGRYFLTLHSKQVLETLELKARQP